MPCQELPPHRGAGAPLQPAPESPFLDPNLFFTRCSSQRRRRAVGAPKSSSSLRMSSWAMRWPPAVVPQPKAQAAGLQLCKKPPWLRAMCNRFLKGARLERGPGASLSSNSPPPRPTSCPFSGSAAAVGAGVGVRALAGDSPQLHLGIKFCLTANRAAFLSWPVPRAWPAKRFISRT